MTHDLGAPVDLEHHHLVVEDLLRQLEGQADPFLDEVLQRHGVRGLRTVGPLTEGTRHSLCGAVGIVTTASRPDPWCWALLGLAYPDGRIPDKPINGYAPTQIAADRALCLALRELGWQPVEVPPEPLEHHVELPPGFVESAEEPARTMQTCPDCEGTGIEEDYGGPWDCPTCEGSGEVRAESDAAEELDRMAADLGVQRQPAAPVVLEGSAEQLLDVAGSMLERGGPWVRFEGDGQRVFSGLTAAEMLVLERHRDRLALPTGDPELEALLRATTLPDGTSLWAYMLDAVAGAIEPGPVRCAAPGASWADLPWEDDRL